MDHETFLIINVIKTVSCLNNDFDVGRNSEVPIVDH